MRHPLAAFAPTLVFVAGQAIAQIQMEPEHRPEREAIKEHCIAHFSGPPPTPAEPLGILYGNSQLAERMCGCAASRAASDDRLSTALATVQDLRHIKMNSNDAMRMFAALLSCAGEAITEIEPPTSAAKNTATELAIGALVPTVARSDFKPPRLRHELCPKPQYPAVARRNGAEGETRLAVFIDGRGFLQKVHIVGSSGDTVAHKILDMQAVASLADCRWIAASKNGQPEDAWTFIAFRWALR